MEELTAASKLLKSSISRYANACSVVVKAYTTPSNVGPDHALLECIRRELQAASSYEVDVKSVNSTLSRCINSNRTVIRIHSLPPEILMRIFELVNSSRSCLPRSLINGRNPEELAEFARPMPSVVLSHVCVRWREITLGSPILWSRTSLVTSNLREPLFKMLVDRGKIFGARSGLWGTELRIDVVPDVKRDVLAMVDQLGRSLTDPEQKLRRLQLYNWANIGDFCDVIQRSLASLAPGTLKQLTLVDRPAARPSWSWVVSTPGRFTVEAIRQHLPSLTALHLIDIELPLSSHIYSGLVDLRLIASRMHDEFRISIPQLQAILISCPSLRIFHFGYMIEFEGKSPNAPPPVLLEELEELNIRGMVDSPELLLRLISSGTKPMDLSVAADFDNVWCTGSIPAPVLKFLERSNVAGLHVDCGRKYGDLWLCSLLSEPFTRLRVLGLKGFMLDRSTISTTVQALPNLNFLHLHDCGIDFEILREFLSACAVSTIKLCRYPYEGCDDQEIVALAPNVVISELPGSRPEPHAVDDWEYWEIPDADM